MHNLSKMPDEAGCLWRRVMGVEEINHGRTLTVACPYWLVVQNRSEWVPVSVSVRTSSPICLGRYLRVQRPSSVSYQQPLGRRRAPRRRLESVKSSDS